jgi:ribosome-associated protein
MLDCLIELAQFLKLQRLVGSGGEAKVLIQDGQVLVNGEVETRRGRKLKAGDIVEVAGKKLIVTPPQQAANEP